MSMQPDRKLMTFSPPARVVPISAIDPDDRRCCMRVWLDIDDLVASLTSDEIRIPLVLRTRADGRFQIVCGFRRMEAALAVGLRQVPAIIRDDLDDVSAFAMAIVDNTCRASYTDIDRAYIIQRYQDEGHSSLDIAQLMGISKRQKNNLAGLLDLPLPVQRAVADPRLSFTTTHAIVLQRWARRSTLDLMVWVERVAREELSVRGLDAALCAEHARGPSGFESLLARELDEGCVVQIRGQRLEVSAMSSDELHRLRGDLIKLLEFLDGRNLRHRG